MKKIINKIVSLVLVSALGLTMISCSSSSTANNSAQQAKFVVATNAEFPPYEYKDGNEFLGIDMELAKEISSKLGMELEIMDIAFDSLIPAITSNKADAIMAGMTVTEDRKQNVSFSTPYIQAVQNIIVKNDSTISTVDDLKDKKSGVQTGTTADLYLTDDLGDDHVERFNKIYDAVVSLQNGKLDAVVVDDQVAKNLVVNNAGLKILPTAYASEEYAIAINKNNQELLNKVNEILSELTKSGYIESLKEKYLNNND